MNLFDQYLVKIDASSYDCRDVSVINAEFQELTKQLIEKGENGLANLADIDEQLKEHPLLSE